MKGFPRLKLTLAASYGLEQMIPTWVLQSCAQAGKDHPQSMHIIRENWCGPLSPGLSAKLIIKYGLGLLVCTA